MVVAGVHARGPDCTGARNTSTVARHGVGQFRQCMDRSRATRLLAADRVA